MDMKSNRHMKIALYGSGNSCHKDFYEYFDLYKECAGLLSLSTGMTFEFLENVDLGFNRKLPNGSWTGLIGMVHRGEADVAVDELIINIDRKEAVDFGYPYRIDEFTFVTKYPEYLPEMFAFLRPFVLSVWLTFAIFFMSNTVISFVAFNKNFSLGKLLFKNFCVVTGQSTKIKLHNTGDRFLSFSWVLGIMLLANCYKSLLLSFLTVPKLEGVRDFRELTAAVQNGKYQCVVAKNSFLPHILLNSDIESLKALGENIDESPNGFGEVDVLLKNPHGNIAYIETRSNVEYLSRKFFVSKDHISPSLFAYAVNKKFCCKKELDRAVFRIWDSGIFMKLFNHIELRKALRRLSVIDYEPKVHSRILSLYEISGIFIILLAGHIISAIVLVLEILCYKERKYL